MLTPNCRNSLLIILLLCACSARAQKIDSLRKELRGARSDEPRAHILFWLADAYYTAGIRDSSLIYTLRSARLAERICCDTISMAAMDLAGYLANEMNQTALAFRYRDSTVFYARRQPGGRRLLGALLNRMRFKTIELRTDGVLDDGREALALARHIGNRADEAGVYRELGYYYGVLRNYSAQLDYVTRSISIYDSIKRVDLVADGYHQISQIYAKQKKYKQSLPYAFIADSIYQKIGEVAVRNVLMVHIGIVYKNLGNYDQAIAIYQRCLDSFRNDTFRQMIVYANLGIAQSLKGHFADAKISFLRSLQFNKKMQLAAIDIDNNKELGRAFLRVGQYDSALHYAMNAERLCKDAKSDVNTYQECIAALSDIYAAMGDMANAHLYDKQYEALQDSIFKQILESNLADAETRFNVVDKDKQLTVLATENELQKLKGQRQAIALILGALVVLIVVVAYRRTVRRNKMLQQQKEMLSEQKAVIDAQVVQLEAAASMKARFLSNISHELRTPATLLTGMLELMKKKAAGRGADENHQLAVAHDNSRRLQRMLEDILDLSRVEQKVDRINIQVREVSPLLRRIIYAFEAVVLEKGLALQYDDSAAAAISVAVDEDKFEKIINNLVYNAVKFNKPSGIIKVTAGLSADGKQVLIEVADTGMGIPAKDLPFVFERFYQGAMSNKAKAEGVGIGLSLVKEFTAQMGGTISVISTAVGTTFSLLLPVAQTVDMPRQAHEDDLRPIPWEKLESRFTVLLVEDNDEMRYYLREVLGQHLDIAEAANGQEALKWLAQNTPDLIISDMMMPEMDGRELVTYIKSNPTWSKIPVITLTALANAGDQMSMLRLGVDDYMVKPFNADELQVRVYNLLHNYAVRRQVAQEPKEADDVVIENDSEAKAFREKVTNYVLKNIKNTNMAVADLATELLLSERQFFRLSKSLTGFTPAQLIKEVRLQHAYELLLSGDITKVEDVANRVGFETPWYFSRQFLERFGKRATDLL